jgi:membrane-associated phospholipid phosphatase
LRPRASKALRVAAAGAVVVGLLAPPLRRRLGLRPPVVSALAWQAPVALTLAAPPSRARAAGVYALQMWAYLAHYEMPHDDPERLLVRTRAAYPARIDRAIGRGEVPTVRLQRALGRPGEVRRHDLALAWVHWAWFLVPHGTVAYVLWRRPERFGRSATLIAATFDAGLVFYWLVPTAPPWWAGGRGTLPEVRRIMIEAGEHYWGRLWRPLYDFLGGNPFAAMPSLHFATSVMAAHVLSGTGRIAGSVGWTYAAALAFALVYLGEHYVVDLAAGLALAEAVRLAAGRAAPLVDSLRGPLGRLEAGAA